MTKKTVETYSMMSQQGSGCYKARQSKYLHCSRNTLVVAMWNRRSLVEALGNERICTKRLHGGGVDCGRNPGPHNVERKLYLMVKELRCYQVSVIGIPQTKWFGMDV